MAIVNDATTSPYAGTAFADLPAGMSPAQYYLASGGDPNTIGAFLYTSGTYNGSSAASPKTSAEAVDRYNNPTKYMTEAEKAAELAKQASWDQMYKNSAVYGSGYAAANPNGDPVHTLPTADQYKAYPMTPQEAYDKSIAAGWVGGSPTGSATAPAATPTTAATTSTAAAANFPAMNPSEGSVAYMLRIGMSQADADAAMAMSKANPTMTFQDIMAKGGYSWSGAPKTTATNTGGIPPRPQFFSPMSADEVAQLAAWDAKYGGITNTGSSNTNTGGTGVRAPKNPILTNPTGTGGIVNGATNTNQSWQLGANGMPPPPPDGNVNPALREVQRPETVQGQLGDILKAGNPLLEAAKARAMQTANARGLQNSSMAAQGGEEAMLAAAMPIATQDASTYQKQALTNQTITNEFLSMDKGKIIDLQKAYAAFQQNNYRFDKDEALKRYINDTGNSTQLKVAAMQQAANQSSIESRLAEIGLQNDQRTKELISSQDFTTQQNLVSLKSTNFTNYSTQLAQINNMELEPADKKNRIDILNQQYAGVPMPDGWIAPVFG